MVGSSVQSLELDPHNRAATFHKLSQTGVLLDGPVPRDDDGRHPGTGGGDQEGAGRGEGEGRDQGDRRPRIGDQQFCPMDHLDLDQRIYSVDKHPARPWKTKVVLPKQSTFKKTVVRNSEQTVIESRG